MRIMLVDDHKLLRQSLKRQLEEFGHEVVAQRLQASRVGKTGEGQLAEFGRDARAGEGS